MEPKKEKQSIKKWIQGIFALALVFIASYFFPEWLDEEQEDLVPVELVRVVDGDTIKVMYEGKERSVRYLFIDTPETVHPKRPAQCYGKEASDRNKEILRSAQQVALKFEHRTNAKDKSGADEDKYGRLLAHIYADGKNVQLQLLEEGLARLAFIEGYDSSLLDEYKRVAERAKERQIGVWSKRGYVTNRGFRDDVCTPISE